MDLKGKTVIIPGASRQIGREIARKFAREGANLILPWFDWPESVTDMEAEFSSGNIDFFASHCDLRNLIEVKEFIQMAAEKFPTIDYLINNIERGGMPVVHGSYEHEYNKDQWDIEFETTLKAKWNLYQSVKLLMNEDGAVVNISSIAGICGRSGPSANFFNDGYSAANAAIESFTRQWARECAPAIRVNELMLGLINSRHGDNTRGWAVLTDNDRQSLMNHTLINRLGNPREVADTVYFLAVQATYITGTVLRMDGGYSLGQDKVPPMPPGIL